MTTMMTRTMTKEEWGLLLSDRPPQKRCACGPRHENATAQTNRALEEKQEMKKKIT